MTINPGRIRWGTGLISLLLLVSAGHADDDKDYAQLAREWNEVQLAVPRAIELITYAVDGSSHARGLERLESLALQGSDLAAEQLAFGYLVGAHGIPVNLRRSQRYFEISVRQESRSALLEYGLLLLSGHRFDIDVERGHSLIQRAAELGHPTARAFLIDELEADGSKLSLTKADAWRQRIGMRMNSLGAIESDAVLQTTGLAYGYGQLSEFAMDNMLQPLDMSRARVFASRIPIEESGGVAESIAGQYMQTSDLRADHSRAKRVLEAQLENLTGWGVNNYAWLLSTSPVDEVRNGELAVTLMEELLADEKREHAWVDTLAAAYAEVGDFEKAVEMQSEAVAGFEQDGDEFEDALRRQRGYSEGQAWRE